MQVYHVACQQRIFWIMLVLLNIFKEGHGLPHSQCEVVDMVDFVQEFQLTVSSQRHTKNLIRLSSGADAGWCAAREDSKPFLQVDFLSPMMITGLHIQGWYELNRTGSVKAMGTREFSLAYGNSSNSLHLAFDKNGSNFMMNESQNIADIQTFILEEAVVSRFVRLDLIGAAQEDFCLMVGIFGCGDKVTAEVIYKEGRTDLGVFLVDRALVSRSNWHGQLTVGDQHECKNICVHNISCSVTIYNSENNTCDVYTHTQNDTDLPAIVYPDGDQAIYQRLFSQEFLPVKTVTGATFTGDKMVFTSPGFPILQYFQQTYQHMQMEWDINFEDISKYPIVLIEDYDPLCNTFKVMTGKFVQNIGSAQQSMILSGKTRVTLSLEVVPCPGTSENGHGFRAIVKQSYSPGMVDKDDTEKSNYDAAIRKRFLSGMLISDAFSGLTANQNKKFTFWSLKYITLNITSFHVSCNTGSLFRIQSNIQTSEYCNLNRPFQVLKFSPEDDPTTINFFFNQFSDERPVDGFVATYKREVYGGVKSKFITKNRTSTVNATIPEYSLNSADIVFVVQSSDAITYSDNWFQSNLMSQIMYTANTSGENPGVRAGWMTFNPSIQIHLDLIEYEHFGPIWEPYYQWPEDPTYFNVPYVAGALQVMRDRMFTTAFGDRPGVPNIGIVISRQFYEDFTRQPHIQYQVAACNAVGIQLHFLTVFYELASTTNPFVAFDYAELLDKRVPMLEAMAKESRIVNPDVETFSLVNVTHKVKQYEVCVESACYYFFHPIDVEDNLVYHTRETAEEFCHEKYNGSLASIHSQTELSIIRHYLERNIRTGNRFKFSKTVHIGTLKQSISNNKQLFHWNDGSPLTYTAWSEDVTNIKSEKLCVVMRLWSAQSENIMKIASCDETPIYFLCKAVKDRGNPESVVAPIPDPTFDRLRNNASYFLCGSGEYVSVFAVCDNVQDCKDESDEDGCSNDYNRHECDGMFQCKEGGCVSYSKYCDFLNDCEDGSDEDCQFVPCDKNEWSCGNGQCVDIHARCDANVDCLDKTDEEQCDICRSGSFRCADGTCIPAHRVCDTFQDCPNTHEDEKADMCTPSARYSCAEYWEAGHRDTGLYALTDGHDKVNAECDFSQIEDNSIVTKFHNIDFDSSVPLWKEVERKKRSADIHSVDSVADVKYQGKSVLRVFMAHDRRRCSQRFTQTCPPNRKAISETLDLRYHEDYWDCLCLQYNYKGYWGSLSYCSEATSQLANDSSVLKAAVDAMLLYDPGPFMTNQVRRRGVLNPKKNQKRMLQFGPIECIEEYKQAQDLYCVRGKPVNSNVKCLYDVDDFGHVDGCRDLTHLQNCESFQCPTGYTKCPNSYCIALRFVCDGQTDCLHGEDEDFCETAGANCTGYFKCQGSPICLTESEVCDGHLHCPEGDDERLCHNICPDGCSCRASEMTCHKDGLQRLSNIDLARTSVLKINTNNSISLPKLDLPFLAVLNASFAKIRDLNADVFSSMKNLLLLDLSFNNLHVLPVGIFLDLKRLRVIYLNGNNLLKTVYSGSFRGLSNIQKLTISGTNIHSIPSNAFDGLTNISVLDLSKNTIDDISNYAFTGLPNLVSLDISGNPITVFKERIFGGMDRVQYLKTDNYKFCCLKPETVTDENCLPHADEFSSCSDLMRMDAARFLLWLIGLCSLVGNSLALLYRFIADRSRMRIGYGVFVTNLCIADFLMGVYLLIIAGADVFYRNRYIWNDQAWRTGPLCKFAGVLSTVSSETSVFFICLITIDRILVIKFPFGHVRFNTKSACIVAACTWLIAVFIALFPLLHHEYFQGEFYSRNAVCLALPLTRDRPNGWEYSISIFVFFNFLTFLLIAVGQWLIFHEVKKSGNRLKSTARQADLRVARNVLLVVGTDFMCWCPIGVMGLMALSGHVISGDVYVWACVLILPINSALNPFLYTLSTIVKKKGFSPSISEQDDRTQQSIKSLERMWKSCSVVVPMKRHYTYMSLEEYIGEPGVQLPDVCQLVQKLTLRISHLHDLGMCYGGLPERNIGIIIIDKEIVDCIVSMAPKQVVKPTDKADDIGHIGALTRRLIRNCVQGKDDCTVGCSSAAEDYSAQS